MESLRKHCTFKSTIEKNFDIVINIFAEKRESVQHQIYKAYSLK